MDSSDSEPSGPIPVAIFTGYLGAGKTTVIQRLMPQLTDTHNERVLTIVNDLSPDNTDIFAFQSAAASTDDGSSGRVSALSGGCVCCNLLRALVEELVNAYAARTCSYIVLECTGVADPAPIVATIAALPALTGKVVLDAVVTVVNAASLADVTTVTDTNEATLDLERADAMGGQQMLGANLVLVNNWESLLARGNVSKEVLAQWPALLTSFGGEANPSTRIFFTQRGSFDFVGQIHRKYLFEADGTLPYYLRVYGASGGVVGKLPQDGSAEEAAEMERLGLRTFTWRSEALILSTKKLRAAVSGPASPGKRLLRKVWRSKGFFEAVDDETTVPALSARKQFRWQSVSKRFDYGEVLPPAVRLVDSASGNEGTLLSFRIVFMGNFDPVKKRAEVEEFFASIAA